MGWEAASWRRRGSSGRTQRWHQEGHPRGKNTENYSSWWTCCFVIWKNMGFAWIFQEMTFWCTHGEAKSSDLFGNPHHPVFNLGDPFSLSAELVPRWALSCCHVPRFLQNFLVSTESFHPNPPGKQTPKSYEKPKAPACDVCSLNNPNKQQINKQTLAYPKLFKLSSLQ